MESTLLHTAQRDHAHESPLPRTEPNRLPERLKTALIRHGIQSSAYFTVQPGLTHHFTEDGCFSFAPVSTPFGTVNLSCTNPLVSPGALEQTLVAMQALPGTPVLMGVTKDVARVAARLGWTVNHMGMEHSIDLPFFDLAGREKKQLRHAANLAKRLPVTVVESTHVPHIPDSVGSISDAWRQTKRIQARELRLLTRPPVFRAEWGVRKFYCHHADGRLLGFIFFDPWFEDGQITGYCANILRSDPAWSKHPILDFTLLHAINRFREEGFRRLSLGIAPLDRLQPCPGHSPVLYRLGQLMYRYGNRMYAFQALAYHKSRYRGKLDPWYVCTPSRNALKITWGVLKGTGILPE